MVAYYIALGTMAFFAFCMMGIMISQAKAQLKIHSKGLEEAKKGNYYKPGYPKQNTWK